MRHSDTGNIGRFAALNQTQNQQSVLQQSVLQSGVPTNPVLGTSPRAASQPPPYPGTQSIPNTGSVFPQQQHTHYPELRANLQYQQPSVVHGPAVFNSNASSQSFGLHAGCTSPHLSPGSLTMQSNIRPVSPGAVGVPRKSLAGMISPIRQQAPQFLNMPPPSSPVVVGGRMQGPLSPLTAYMSQTSQRRLSADHTPSLSSRSSQSPVYCQNPVPYNFSPQRHQGVLQRSPTPSPMYVDPAQHGQISPVFTHGPHHSPQSVGAQGIQIVRSPYKAARQLNMSTPASKTPQYVPPGGTNQPQWQCGYNTGCSEAWENVSVTPLAPLPILTSDTLDLLSTITVSTASSPMQPSSNVTVVDSQMPRSTLLEQHLLMPATPIRTSLPGSFPMTSGESSTRSSSGAQQCESAHTAMPPSRSNSKQTARLTLDVSAKKATKKPVTESRRAVTTPTTSAVISVKSENTFRETMTSPITNTIPSYAEGNSATVSDSLQPAVSAPTDDHCDIPMVDPEIIEKRMRLLEAYRARLQNRFDLYKEHLTELFFLRNGGNFMDYTQFKKRPSTKLLDYLKSKLPDLGTGQKAPRKASHDSTNGHSKSPDADVLATAHLLKVAPEGCVRKCSVSRDDGLVSPEQRKDRKDVDDKRLQCHDEATKPGELQRLIQQKTFAQVITESKPPPSKLKRLPKQSTSNQLDESIGSQEEILERAKQEAVIQRKVVELRKQGLWSQRRLPKVQEPPRSKTHWDYMLEEMRWLAADFAQERKWKRAAARKLVRAVAAFHKDQHDQERRAKKEEQNRLRRIASTMARGIREFWGNVGKVVEYKQRSLLDEKRKEALDMHLDFVVGQTEKYSDWLVKGLNQPTGLKDGSDDDFLPHGQSTDDEETIAVAEQDPEEENEVLLLTQESKLPFDDLLSSLPEDLIENIGKPLTENAPAKPVDSTEQVVEEPASDDSANEASVKKPSSISLRRSARKRKLGVPLPEQLEAGGKRLKENEEDDADDAFDARNEDSAASDDESTIAKEEEQENVDHGKEIADLEAEGALSIEELLKMYGAPASPNQEDQGSGVEEIEADQVLSEAEQDESSCEEEDGDDEDTQNEDIGMDYLLKVDADKDDIGPMIIPADEKPRSRDSSPSKEITDVAAEAASLQPTGFTLATTQVVTPIPSLLKHTLREYQHIGLDWLVTMYDKRLNGILADEMGLGKTIQTIALLAHLACDKGVWGPHLVVVPTSVMLNWEMEFKKWCPGFKILTYYGSQKERKAKRTGWTKSNAFHVCITSYKLVLQDNSSFRRKKWKYLILDEAQNIKNFKSQRWQTLLNFNSHRRLLLTGTPLQNNLMELWSLMHFLMPHVFQSHKEFKEWFSNPLTGMVEGGQEYNEKLVRRLHKVLRPFLLRRIKKDVEKQMPNKYEHVVRCHLSKRQRFLYDDFMSQASTKDTLESGHFMSVINILMQLRKVCNHPNLFEPRPIVSPFFTDQISYHAPSLATKAMEKTPWESLNLRDYHMHLPTLSNIHQTHVDLIRRYRTPRKLIEEIPEDGGAATSAREELPKAVSIKEQLVNLIKERSKSGKTSQQSAHKPVPYLTIPITSSTGSLQLPSTSGQAIVQSRVITIPQSKSEDSVSGRTASSPAFTLQYQTSQGTRVSIPSKQIKQLPANILRIMTPAMSAKTPAPNAQNVASSSVQGGSTIRSKAFSKTNTDESTTEREMIEVKEPGLYTERLEEEFMRQHKERCLRVAEENEKRCCVTPTWLPGDTVSFLKDIYQRCDRNKPHTVNSLKSDVILELVKSASCRTKELKPITDRFAFVIPLVESKPIDFYVSHPSPSIKLKADQSDQCLQEALKVSLSPFHSIILSTRIQFPEARLIQYDCGKLQVLDVLLRRFYTEKHKCLIFTQMTKVLDILEAFLSYHGYRYLRLDGSTRVEQRMLLMERFNNDPRIFCFILSTRSGGIGVNLTGADTVIFYDSDWNPTMDAQAQDRCHRIGQTRDVHIYRLISERTVEENILKKANQKRLLGDIAIEGGSFTTAFFKEQAIKDLFDKPTGLEDLPTIAEKPDAPETEVAPSKPLTARQKAIAAAKEAKSDKEGAAATSEVGPSLEDVLQQTEDKEDVDAAKQLREEQDADMEEFTENADEDQTAVSRVHEEMKSIYEELTPIEKYALRYLEETTEEVNREELEQAEERVYRSKQDWELAHLVALKEEEERRLEEEEDEIFYTREDAENQMYIDEVTKEMMPIWCPPTPPQDDNDVYIDPIASLLYVPGPMPDDLLPVLQAKNARKRTKTEAENAGSASQRKKVPRLEVVPPRSLFDRQTVKKSQVKSLKSRKEQSAFSQVKISSRVPSVAAAGGAASTDKTAGSNSEHSTSFSGTGLESVITSAGTSKNPDWLPHEDWKLMQAVQENFGMPLSLSMMMPAHTPNWDLVADVVNTVSSIYRSPKMCKQRFESVTAPSEESRNVSDVVSIKKKGTKTPVKPKALKVQKASNMPAMDTSQYHALYAKRFGVIKEICAKRTAPVKTSGSGQFQRNPKHMNILVENGINFDKPLNPEQVAEMRAQRIQREKEAAKQQQQMAQSQAMHAGSGQQATSSQVSKPGISSIGQLTAIPLSGSSTANIIVNTSAFKKINPHNVSKTTISSSALQQTLLRTASTGDQSQLHQSPIQIQQGQAVIQGQSAQVLKTKFSKPQQHPRFQQMLQKPKKITKTPGAQQKFQLTTEAVKKIRQQQQLDANVVTVAKVAGKAKKATSLTPQELEQILKNQRATTHKAQAAQVQIAPVHAQAQAQQVQEAAAQQAAQHIVTSKPLPLTVSVSGLVSAVNLGSLSTSFSIAGTSGQGKSLVMTAPFQQHIQRHLMKQRLVSQQTQVQQPAQAGQVLTPKVGMKQTVYAMVAASPQLVTQNKRPVSVATSVVQGGASQQVVPSGPQPVLTVTKLLHAQAMQGQPVQMKQALPQGSEALVQQVRHPSTVTQQLQMGQTTILPSSSMAQQRVITPQRQIRQLQQQAPMILTQAAGQQFLQRQASQNIVGSLVSTSATDTLQQTVLSTPVPQTKLPQQLQSLLNNPQVIKSSTQNPAGGPVVMRNAGQQHQLVLQQQPTFTVSQQNVGNQISIAGSSTTSAVASLVLPVTAIPRSQTEAGEVSSVHFVTKTTSR